MTARRAHPKTPRRPAGPLTRTDADLVRVRSAMWRIAATQGEHVLGWDELRAYGPLRTMRWDPHHEPPREQPDRAVLYASPDPRTALAEKYQKYREVDPWTDAPYLYGWTSSRDLVLLDVRGGWPLRNGASATLPTGPRNVCRAWAEAILDTWEDLDGIITGSAMDGRDTYALFPQARSSTPPTPLHARALAHPHVYAYVHRWVAEIGYGIAPRVASR
ncbi:RES family NAD+ phosphorylase [Intrasporangium sp.]|uniref:RES family NAD+ phosphorylase n=1 Tax=Intrasporangium sp. TaxID=1925024 RepID=UPI003221648E